MAGAARRGRRARLQQRRSDLPREPIESVAAASSERPSDLAPEQALAPLEAWHAWTAGAAGAAGLADRGRLREGAAADLVLIDGPLDRDPAGARVRLTAIAGAVAFEADGGGPRV